jgi:hypothetical protein
MAKMSFAQRIDVWRPLTAPPADLADEVPGLAELRGELETILEDAPARRPSIGGAPEGAHPTPASRLLLLCQTAASCPSTIPCGAKSTSVQPVKRFL